MVLVGLGGPSSPDEVVPFVYHRLMDPAEVYLPVSGWARRQLAKVLARRWGRGLREAFELIGGCSPLRRLAAEQAAALQRRLGDTLADYDGVTVKTYVAMRHGGPSLADVCGSMQADGVTKVVLLPLDPHYSVATTGSAARQWAARCERFELPTTLIPEFSAHPRFVQALNDRVDEGLQRFSREDRPSVQLLFVGHGIAKRRLTRDGDPYCCQVHATVRALRAKRDEPGRAVRTAFLDPLGLGGTHGLSVVDAIDDMAADGSQALLVVPISFTTDRIETAYHLDVSGRARAAEQGVSRFEVTSGINAHPALVDALADVVGHHLYDASAAGGDGLATSVPHLSPSPVPSAPPCPVCDRSVPVRAWAEWAARPASEPR